MRRRRRLNRNLWASALLLATVVAGSILVAPRLNAPTLTGGLAPVAAYTAGPRNVGDEYDRVVLPGLGRAPVGGAWAVSPADSFGVGNGAGQLRGLAAGHSARATLSAVSAGNQQLRTTFTLDALPTGRGVYFALETRRQHNGDAYRTKVFVTPNGTTRLNVVQVGRGTERKVSDYVVLAKRVRAHQPMNLETFVTGTSATATNLKARVWPAAAPTPSWQLTVVQRDRDRITSAGSVGLWFYTAVRNPAPAITIDHTVGWQLRPTSGSTPTPPSRTPTPSPTGSSPSRPVPSKTPTKTPRPPSSSSKPTPKPTPTTSSATPTPTRSTSTTPPPPADQVPGPGNTGVPAGTKLTIHNGNLKITRDGASYSGLDIRGFVDVEARNVTIKNSIIRGGRATTNIGLVNAGDGSSGFRILDSELTPQYPSVWIDGIKGWNYRATRLNIHGTVDGAKVYGNNVLIEKSWIHDTRFYSQDPNQRGGPSHNDGVQILSGAGISITGNTIIGGDNAALQVTQGHGTVQGLTFVRNQVGGGACTLNITSNPLSSIGSVTLTSNRFLRTSQYKCPMIIDQDVRYVSSDNRFLDNGQAVNVVPRG